MADLRVSAVPTEELESLEAIADAVDIGSFDEAAEALATYKKVRARLYPTTTGEEADAT